jgi:hypothetical protein
MNKDNNESELGLARTKQERVAILEDIRAS